MKKINYISILIGILFFSLASIANIVAVNSNSCQSLSNNKEPFILVLKEGEKLIPSIIKCIDSAQIESASLTAVGALVNPKLAYFDNNEKKYQYKTFRGTYELLGLNGNVTMFEGKHVVHAHATLGDPAYQVIGGHLDEAAVGATAEITILPLRGIITKKISPDTGLPAISAEKTNPSSLP